MKVVYTPPNPDIILENMTLNKSYEVIMTDVSDYPSKYSTTVHIILNDTGELKSYLSTNFTYLDTYRENLIEEILK